MSKKCSNKSIERHVLSPVGSFNTTLQEPAMKCSDLSDFTYKPHVGLLFVAPGMFWGREENHKLEQEVAVAYVRHFASKLLTVGCNECLTERSESLRSCEGPLGPATGIPGLLFWPSDGLRIRVSHDDVGLHRYTDGRLKFLIPDLVEDHVAELGLEDHDNSTLLVFVNSFPSFLHSTACLFNTLWKRCRGKKTNLWGGYINDYVSIAENKNGNCIVKNASFVLIRLSGPTLESASTIIQCNQSRVAVDMQLKQLERSFKPRRNTVLLMSGSVEIDAGADGYKDYKEFKAAAMRIFENHKIQIIATFSNALHTISFELSTHENNHEPSYLRRNCISVIILSYD